MNSKRLPVGNQDFERLRTTNSYYVDKTLLVRELIDGGDHYFLSRPRRFGKSLLVSTLKALFEGQEDLFRGLNIYDHWDWSGKFPVVRLSFDGGYGQPGNVESHSLRQLRRVAQSFDITLASDITSGPECLEEVIYQLHAQTGERVVILVDEYDKPILDVLSNSDLATANREYLRGFYGMIKGCAEHIRFVFVTGVSMFSKVSLFSGLNNLRDISLDRRFATICGYTDKDIDTVFAPELEGLDRDQMRHWYNGYNWRGEERVYNPFGVLLFFCDREFKSYWFETATPDVLFQMMERQKVSTMELEKQLASDVQVTTFDVHDIDLRALMFQTGYLTIVGEKEIAGRRQYILDYPNWEVRKSFNFQFLMHLKQESVEITKAGGRLLQLLEEHDFDGFARELGMILAGLPHHWYDQSNIHKYEAHYLSGLYMYLQAMDTHLHVEEASSRGRADMVVFHAGQVFVLECKVAQSKGQASRKLEEAMAQMRGQGYGKTYLNRYETIHLVATVFGTSERELLGIRVEQLMSK